MPDEPKRIRRLPRKSWTLSDVVRLQSLLLGRLADALRQPDLDTDTLIRLAHAISQASNATRQTIIDAVLEPLVEELGRRLDEMEAEQRRNPGARLPLPPWGAPDRSPS